MIFLTELIRPAQLVEAFSIQRVTSTKLHKQFVLLSDRVKTVYQRPPSSLFPPPTFCNICTLHLARAIILSYWA